NSFARGDGVFVRDSVSSGDEQDASTTHDKNRKYTSSEHRRHGEVSATSKGNPLPPEQSGDQVLTTADEDDENTSALRRQLGMRKVYHLTTERCKEELRIHSAQECEDVAAQLGLSSLRVEPTLPPELIKHAGCYYDQTAGKLYFQPTSDPRDRSRNFRAHLAICLSHTTQVDDDYGHGGHGTSTGGFLLASGATGTGSARHDDSQHHDDDPDHGQHVHILSFAFLPLYFTLLALSISAVCQMLSKLLPFSFP
ncbi:unnamed protein product, partial [Amoebophrya sp. A25]